MEDQAGHIEHPDQGRADLSALASTMRKVEGEIGKLIIGQKDLVHHLLVALLADGHVILEGVPGVAKTMASKILAKVVDTNFSRIQFTPDLMPSDVLGTSIFNFNSSTFEFKMGPIFSNIVLIDEINRAPAKTQAALFEVMQERQITSDGKTRKLDAPFIVLATQNPIEQEGTYQLPEAQLDRFLMKILVDYPSLDEEVEIIELFHSRKDKLGLEEIQSILKTQDLEKFKEQVHSLVVEPKVMRYIAEIVQGTRQSKDFYLGASPRASLSLLRCAKAQAALLGRDFVIPEDVQDMVKPVLRHRVILSPEREMEGLTADKLIDQMVQMVEVPR